MGFWKWLGSQFRDSYPKMESLSDFSEDYLREFSKDKLSQEKWMEHYFKIHIGEVDKSDVRKVEEAIEKAHGNILSFAMGAMIQVDTVKVGKKQEVFRGSMGKSITSKYIEDKEGDYFLIRFADLPKNPKPGYSYKSPKSRRSYLFSPYQSLVGVRILYNIEDYFHKIFGIKPHQGMTDLQFRDGEPYVTSFDGLQFEGYPLEKRMVFGKKFPDIDEFLFGSDLDYYLKWILEKEDANPHMKKYCGAVKKLMKKHKISI